MVNKTTFRLLLLTALCGVLAAQQQQQQQQQDPFASQDDITFRSTVQVVTAPVTVFDRDGSFVNDVRPEQFRLFDNDKEQNIKVDVTYIPISLVIAIQANSHVEGMLPQVRKIGSMISPLVIGDQGEAAVVAYDSRLRLLQDFTSDPTKITDAVRKIQPGSMSNRMVDSVFEAARMLRHQPQNHRRILLLIGETRDLGSEGRAREALIELQLNNISFYAVDMSRLLSTLSAPVQQPAWDNTPPASHALPANTPATPTTVMQSGQEPGTSADFLPLMIELYKDAKAIFKANPVQVFTRGTGGAQFSFFRERGLEEAISKLGEELHSQYLISYNPNNKLDGGFHQITVTVSGRPDVKKIQTRPGYWLAGKPGE